MNAKEFKKSYQKLQNSLRKSPHFSFRPLYIIHQKMHHIIPVWEPNSAGCRSYSLTQLPDSPFQFHLPGQARTNVSHILPLQRIIQISSPHSRGLVFRFYTFILVWQQVSFPERNPHGTGLTPAWLQKVLSKSQKQQRSPSSQLNSLESCSNW